MAAYVAEIEHQVVEGLDRVDEIARASLTAVRSMSEQVAGFLPELPAVPFVELIPAPREIVKSTFNVVDRVVDGQRRFADGFVDAIAPVTTKLMPWAGRDRKASRPAEGKSMSRAAEAA